MVQECFGSFGKNILFELEKFCNESLHFLTLESLAMLLEEQVK